MTTRQESHGQRYLKQGMDIRTFFVIPSISPFKVLSCHSKPFWVKAYWNSPECFLKNETRKQLNEKQALVYWTVGFVVRENVCAMKPRSKSVISYTMSQPYDDTRLTCSLAGGFSPTFLSACLKSLLPRASSFSSVIVTKGSGCHFSLSVKISEIYKWTNICGWCYHNKTQTIWAL